MSVVSAPYMRWAKTHRHARFDLTGSNLVACLVEDLAGAREALELGGDNDNGYRPLVEAIAARYGVSPEQVATASGASGANFFAAASLVGPGDEVVVERPGYDPLLGIPRFLGASVTRFNRRFEDGFRLDPDRIAAAMTPRTSLVIISNPHNPSGVVASEAELEAAGRVVERAGARLLVDEVYLDAVPGPRRRPAAALGPALVTTSSLTKAYGLAGLRCGWVIATPDITERVRRVHDVVDAIGPFPAERLALLAFQQIDWLEARSRRIVQANSRAAQGLVERTPELACVPTDGGLVLFPRLVGSSDATPLVDWLFHEFEVGVVAGLHFEAPAHLRLALGGRPESVGEALDRLGKAFDAMR